MIRVASLIVLLGMVWGMSAPASAQPWEKKYADKLVFSSNAIDETKTITILSAALATGGWTYTLPDALGSASFALTTTAGATLFSGPTATRTYTLPDISTTLLTTNTAVTVGQGGTGQSSGLTQGGIIFGSTTSAMGSTAVGSTGQILRSAATGTPTWSTATYPATAGTAGNYLRSDATNFVSSAILAGDLPGSFSGFANPTASIGLSTINGSATTAMRSDGAPALDVTISPTWTGTHTIKKDAIATTFTNGLLLTNTTASTAGVPVQQSPSLLFRSHVWNTTATAADSTIDARMTLVPVSGAATTPVTNSALQFTFGNTATTNTKSLTMSSRKISTADSEMILEETGDQYGTTRLRLQNRNGSNGPLFEMAGQFGIDLCDFGFKPNAGVQSNLRLEARTSTIRNTANNAFGEFQFYMNTLSANAGTATYNFSTGEGATTIEVGNVGIGMRNPLQKLEVMSGNLLLATTTANADSLEFQGPTGNTGITTFTAGAQGSTNINYLLPTTAPTANQVLTATSVSAPAVTLGWISPGPASKQILTTTSSSTYTTPTGVTAIIVELVGGGGAGGGTPSASSGNGTAGGGGGGGGYTRALIVNPSATYTYSAGTAGTGASGTVGGNGGTSTFGTITALGGTGGAVGPAGTSATGNFAAGGSGGGAGANGDFTVLGGDGGSGIFARYVVWGGPGGGSYFGGGQANGGSGGSAPAAASVAGIAGQQYGGGGTGAYAYGGTTARAGGNGAAGVIIVYEYK